jgi:hypothetical protein
LYHHDHHHCEQEVVCALQIEKYGMYLALWTIKMSYVLPSWVIEGVNWSVVMVVSPLPNFHTSMPSAAPAAMAAPRAVVSGMEGRTGMTNVQEY